ncbi:MAG: S8 family serine peptidase [Cyclobacteriaceae bacterium]
MKKIVLTLLCLYFIDTLGVFAQHSESRRARIDPYLAQSYRSLTQNQSSSGNSNSRKLKSNTNHFQKSIKNHFHIELENESYKVHCILEFKGNVSELRKHGVVIRSKIGNFYTASFDLEALEKIRSIDGLLEIEMSRALKPELDAAREAIDLGEAFNNHSYRGNGVIIGIVDTGIDITHPSFQKTNGDTRILHIWDQAKDGDNPPSGFNYGQEWNASHINNEQCTHLDRSGAGFKTHGTHVAGIAAGNGRGASGVTPYVGVAPEADIIMVAYKQAFGTNLEKHPVFVDSVIDGIAYIAKKAKDAGKPWVVNLSLGAEGGPRNGTSLLERAINEVANDISLGSGRIVVKSAGNDGYISSNSASRLEPENRIHADATGTATKVFAIDRKRTEKGHVFLEIYTQPGHNYSVTLRSPGGVEYGPIQKGEFFASEDTPEGFIFINNDGEDFVYNGTDDQIFITINDFDSDGNGVVDDWIPHGNWRVTLNGNGAEWDAYVISTPATPAYFSSTSFSNRNIISEPGNAHNVITVGSINTKNTWPSLGTTAGGYSLGTTSWFSSPGPTRSGLNKPDLKAPGAFIASAKAVNSTDESIMNASDAKYVHKAGTSMSAAFVSGAAALLLQKWNVERQENFTHFQIKDILFQTSLPSNILNVDEALALNDGIVVGIEDRVKITDPKGWPKVINRGTRYTYKGRFTDEWPYGDYALSFNWKIKLFHSEGEHLVASKNINPGGSDFTTWTHTFPNNLPTRNWNRDSDNNIMGEVILTARDNDGFTHTYTLEISVPFKPNPPIIYSHEVVNQSSINLSYVGAGADSYRIYYDYDPDPTNANYVTTTEKNYSLPAGGLRYVSYAVWVAGVNSAGVGPKSEPIYVHREGRIPPKGHSIENPVDLGTIAGGSISEDYSYTSSRNTNPFYRYGNNFNSPYNQSTDDVFFKFDLQFESEIDISTCDFPTISNTVLHLLNADGQPIVGFQDYGSNCQNGGHAFIHRTLSPGKYYIVLESNEGQSYDLTLKIDVDIEPKRYPITWTDKVNAFQHGQSLVKSSMVNDWNSGGASLNVIPANKDGFVEFEVPNRGQVMYGLSYSNDDQDFRTIDFAMFTASGILHAYQRGSYRKRLGSYNTGDILKLERVGSNVNFKKNGTILYSLPANNSAPMIADVSMRSPFVGLSNGVVLNAKCSHIATSGLRGVEQNESQIVNTPSPNPVQVYPNPFENEITISGGQIMETVDFVRVFDSAGSLVYSQALNVGESGDVKLIGIVGGHGLYFINLYSPKGKVLETLKVFKK